MNETNDQKCDCKGYDTKDDDHRAALIKMELPEYEYMNENGTGYVIYRAMRFIGYVAVLLLLGYSLWRIQVIESALAASDRFTNITRLIAVENNAHHRRTERSIDYGKFDLNSLISDDGKSMARGTMETAKNEDPLLHPKRPANKNEFDQLINNLFDKIQGMHNDTNRDHFEKNMKDVFNAWFPVFDALLRHEMSVEEHSRKVRSVDASSEESHSNKESSEEKKSETSNTTKKSSEKSSEETNNKSKEDKSIEKSSEESSEEKNSRQKRNTKKSSEESSEEKNLKENKDTKKSSEESSEEKKPKQKRSAVKSSEESSEETKPRRKRSTEKSSEESSEEKKPKHNKSSEESSEETKSRNIRSAESSEESYKHKPHNKKKLLSKKQYNGMKDSDMSSASSESSQSSESNESLERKKGKFVYHVIT